MAIGSISSDMLHLELRQLGAKKIHSNINRVMVVKFEINPDLNVSYFLHIKDEEKIYIQRIEPYPIRNYRFETIENIINFIKKDVELFRNAANSSNFDLFLDMITKNFEVRKEIEDLFLSNNVPHELLEAFVAKENTLLQDILATEHIALGENIEKYDGEEINQKNTLEARIDKDNKAGKYVKDIYGEEEIIHPAVLSDMITDMIKKNMSSEVKAMKKELIEELTDKVADKVMKQLKK